METLVLALEEKGNPEGGCKWLSLAEERCLDGRREELLALQRELEASGELQAASLAQHTLALLRHVFLPTTTQLPEELRAGALQFTGLLLLLGWELAGLPEEAEERLRESARAQMLAAAPAAEEAQAAAPAEPPAPPLLQDWLPPVVDAEEELDSAALAPRFQAAVALLAKPGEDGSASDAGQVMSVMLRQLQTLHAAHPRAQETRRFVLGFCAEALGRRGDAAGGQLLDALSRLLRFETPTARLGGLGEGELAALRTAQARAERRGWVEAQAGKGTERAAPPDPDRALKDGFAYALLCFVSRMEQSHRPS